MNLDFHASETGKQYGKSTTKLFQVKLKPEEYDMIDSFIKEQGITKRNYMVRSFAVVKKIIKQKFIKQASQQFADYGNKYLKKKGR
ncbi:MAG: hypothetical protein HUU49_03320 [Candidatus Buchananbacteria bacterium]|nr:hypothetical protein [Candidatus Buchananbacteria bacterium]